MLAGGWGGRAMREKVAVSNVWRPWEQVTVIYNAVLKCHSATVTLHIL